MNFIFCLLVFVTSVATQELDKSKVRHVYHMPDVLQRCSNSSFCQIYHRSKHVKCEMIKPPNEALGGICMHDKDYINTRRFARPWGVQTGLAMQYIAAYADPDFLCESHDACQNMYNGNAGTLMSPNLRCVENKCQCPPGYKWTEVKIIVNRVFDKDGINFEYHVNECHKDPDAPKSCIEKDDPLICDPSQDLVCNKDTGACDCPKTMTYSEEMNKCLLNGGESCLKPDGGSDEYEDYLCYSEKCLDGKCACTSKDEVWSNKINKCVTDLLGKDCTSDDECVNKDLDVNELACNDGKCGMNCTDGFTFHWGACVNASSSIDETCDPHAVEKMGCKTEPIFGLVCDRKTLTCRCGTRTVGKGDKTVTIELSVNPISKGCDVKPDGSPCEIHSECLSGQCKNKKCSKGTLTKGPKGLGYKEKCGKHHVALAVFLLSSRFV